MKKLPISISAEQAVCEDFKLPKSVLEKMEAWANFEALKANWYGNESSHLKCQFTLVSAHTFENKFAKSTQEGWQIDNKERNAIKTGDIDTKHHVVLAIDDSFNTPCEHSGAWIGPHIQANLQGVIRLHLLAFAKLHQLDPID